MTQNSPSAPWLCRLGFHDPRIVNFRGEDISESLIGPSARRIYLRAGADSSECRRCGKTVR